MASTYRGIPVYNISELENNYVVENSYHGKEFFVALPNVKRMHLHIVILQDKSFSAIINITLKTNYSIRVSADLAYNKIAHIFYTSQEIMAEIHRIASFSSIGKIKYV